MREIRPHKLEFHVFDLEHLSRVLRRVADLAACHRRRRGDEVFVVVATLFPAQVG
jgi:hypothetical protein